MIKNNGLLVSVIIPAFNAEKYLSEAVESILTQTYKNIEVIIIDDKSTDNTVKIATQYAKSDKRVNVIINERNLGVGGNRSKGILIAKGEYICWQDADDISLPDRIKKQVALLEERPDVGAVGGWIQFFDGKGDGVIRRYAEDDATLRSKIFMYNPVAQPASMFRARCYEAVGLYDENYKVSEDLEMLFRVGEKYQFNNVQCVVLKYRQSETSLTATKLREMERVTLNLRSKYRYSPSYAYTLMDAVYNVAQRLSLYMPSRLRMFIFKIVRGDS